MRIATLSAVLAALLAGPGCFGMCGLMPSEASWTDPALFDGMPPPGTAGATWTEPGPGLPFAIVVDPAWGPHNLSIVERTSGDPGVGTEVRVNLSPEAGLMATRENTTPEQDVRSALHAFLGNATTLDAAARAAFVDAMLGNGTAGGEYHYGGDGETMLARHTVTYTAPAPRSLRLEGLYRDLERIGVLSVGLGGASAGPWAFGFSLAVRTLEADGGRLEVGPTGAARFEGFAEGERSEDSYRRDVRDWLTAHQLPVPAEMHVGGSIC